MNTYQVLQHMKALLLARVWTGGTEKVFSYQGVKITNNPDFQAFLTLPTPFALIVEGEFQSDPLHGEEPNLMVGQIVIKVGVAHQDSIGEAAIIGANKIGGNITSKGRGLSEIEVELMATLQALNTIDGVELQLVAKGNQQTNYETQGGYRAYKDFAFELVCTAEPVYQPPLQIAAVASGAGAVALSWTNPTLVSDTVSLVLRRAPGAVPPARPTDGSSVAIGALVTSVSDSPGVGQFSYSLFMSYKDGTVSILNYSAPISITVTAT